MHSAAIYADVTAEAANAATRRFLRQIHDDATGLAYCIVPPGVQRGTLEELRPLLVMEHERVHYRQMAASPIGHLVSRLFNSLVSLVSTIAALLDEFVEPSAMSLPLQDWYSASGRHELGKRAPLQVRRVPGFAGRTWDYEVAFRQLETLARFVEALFGDARLTMSEFVDLANEAFGVMTKISGGPTPTRWRALDGSRRSYLPSDGTTLTEIAEAGARLEEFQIVLSCGDTTASDHWREMALTGPYRRVFDRLTEALCHAEAASAAVEVALTTPIDPACRMPEGVLYVEEVLPSWRLSRVADELGRSVWPSAHDRLHEELIEGIARRSGIVSPRAAIESVPEGAIARWREIMGLQGFDPRFSACEFIEHVESEVRRGTRARLSDFFSPRRIELVPVLQVYSDSADHRGAKQLAKREALELSARGLIALTGSIANVALLSDGDLSEITRVQSAFEISNGAHEVCPPNLRGILRSLALDMMPTCLRPLLSW